LLAAAPLLSCPDLVGAGAVDDAAGLADGLGADDGQVDELHDRGHGRVGHDGHRDPRSPEHRAVLLHAHPLLRRPSGALGDDDGEVSALLGGRDEEGQDDPRGSVRQDLGPLPDEGRPERRDPLPGLARGPDEARPAAQQGRFAILKVSRKVDESALDVAHEELTGGEQGQHAPAPEALQDPGVRLHVHLEGALGPHHLLVQAHHRRRRGTLDGLEERLDGHDGEGFLEVLAAEELLEMSDHWVGRPCRGLRGRWRKDGHGYGKTNFPTPV